MGKINSVLGDIKKSVGNLNFRKWKSVNVVAAKATSVHNPRSTAQTAQRNWFTLMVAASRMLNPVNRIGFKFLISAMTVFNRFIRENKAFKTLSGDVYIPTWASLIISKGSLLNVAWLTSVLDVSNGSFDVTWTDNSDGITGFTTDKAIFAAYNVTQDKWLTKTDSTATRTTGTATVSVPSGFAAVGNTVRMFMFFEKADGSAVSDSTNQTMTVQA